MNNLKKKRRYKTKNSNIYKNKTQSKTAQNKQRERNLNESKIVLKAVSKRLCLGLVASARILRRGAFYFFADEEEVLLGFRDVVFRYHSGLQSEDFGSAKVASEDTALAVHTS